MTTFKTLLSVATLVAATVPAWAESHGGAAISDGPHPFYLIDRLEDGPLKQTLAACKGQAPQRSDWPIAHRAVPLLFPEYTAEGFRAGAQTGAGIVECEVTFTKDKELVCRPAQNDLHTTKTDLAATCTTPFTPATFKPGMQELADRGVGAIAPPMWMLLTPDAEGRIVASPCAQEAQAAGLGIIA